MKLSLIGETEAQLRQELEEKKYKILLSVLRSVVHFSAFQLERFVYYLLRKFRERGLYTQHSVTVTPTETGIVVNIVVDIIGVDVDRLLANRAYFLKHSKADRWTKWVFLKTLQEVLAKRQASEHGSTSESEGGEKLPSPFDVLKDLGLA